MLQQKVKTIKEQKLSTENLKKFIARRRWAVSCCLAVLVNIQNLLTKLYTSPVVVVGRGKWLANENKAIKARILGLPIKLKLYKVISLYFPSLQRTANALRALSRMGSLGGLMAGGGKPGGAAAAPKPGGFLQKVKEEKAKEEAQDKTAKPEPKKEPVKKEAPKEEPKKISAGDSLVPERRGPSFSGRRSPALSGRRSPLSRAEARKYSTPDPRVRHVCVVVRERN